MISSSALELLLLDHLHRSAKKDAPLSPLPLSISLSLLFLFTLRARMRSGG